MSMFDVHTKDTAPEAAKPVMDQVEQKFGMVPNLIGVMAEAPALAKGYATLSGILGESSLSPAEQQLLLLTTSRENGCEYCVAAHTGGAKRAQLDEAAIEAVRDGKDIPDAKLNALSKFCATMVEKRGWAEPGDIQAFLDAGYTKQNVLEVILAIAVKTMSNYTNHIAETPLDEPFKPLKWEKAA